MIFEPSFVTAFRTHTHPLLHGWYSTNEISDSDFILVTKNMVRETASVVTFHLFENIHSNFNSKLLEINLGKSLRESLDAWREGKRHFAK